MDEPGGDTGDLRRWTGAKTCPDRWPRPWTDVTEVTRVLVISWIVPRRLTERNPKVRSPRSPTRGITGPLLDPCRCASISSPHLFDRSRPHLWEGVPMRCPRCRHANPTRQKLCGECGMPLRR